MRNPQFTAADFLDLLGQRDLDISQVEGRVAFGKPIWRRLTERQAFKPSIVRCGSAHARCAVPIIEVRPPNEPNGLPRTRDHGPGSPLSSSGLMILAGTPATTTPGGTSFVTTDPAPTIAPGPITTPGRTTQWTPTNAPVPIRVSATTSVPRPVYAIASSCARIVERAEIVAPSSTKIFSG